MPTPTTIIEAPSWVELSIGDESWRLCWDDDEGCDHILFWRSDESGPGTGAWHRVGGGYPDDGIYSDEILPWIVVDQLCERRRVRG